jgi:uncharacterized protein
MSRSRPWIDLHVHMAGVGTQGSGCWVSPAFRRRPTFMGLRLLMGISGRQMEATVDQDWAALTSGLVAQSDLDLGVILGFDGVYDGRGELDRERSQLIVPPSWLFRVCERYANLLPAPSINPYRRDALDLLEESIERGAVMIKWLPIVQAFDPASPRSRPFLRRMADAGLPLLIHAGTGELTFRTVDPTAGSLDGVVSALEEGVTVVCAHTAAPVHFSRETSELPRLVSLLTRYPHLWVDNSGLANPARFRHLPRFARDPLIAERTVHGSDFPVLSSGVYYARQLGRSRVAEIAAERNPLHKDVALKRAIGFADQSFSRAADILANLDRWYSPSPRTEGRRASP